MSDITSQWSTFHGDPAHTGYVIGSRLTTQTIAHLKPLYTREIGGAILSVPAIANGSIYVGTANGTMVACSALANGGSFHRIDLPTGEIQASYFWQTARHEGDTHGFTGMGCTPAIVDGLVYFTAFDGKMRCLDAETLELVWTTDLRCADPEKNQPITNTLGTADPNNPQAEGWGSPLVVNGRLYVGLGEGENPDLFSFVYCLCAKTGIVLWLFCTNQFVPGIPNQPNVLPKEVVGGRLPEMFSLAPQTPASRGSSVWSSIAFDEGLDCIFCTTGNPTPDVPLGQAPPYSYGILALDAQTGEENGFFQAPPESNYRPSDIDVDFGGSPVVFHQGNRTVVAAACKNGSIFLVDAATMTCLNWRQMLPYHNDGSQVVRVDPHGPDTGTDPDPPLTNAGSNATPAENLYGSYSTPAVHPELGRLFIGIGGNNYHFIGPGIDSESTPFMRVLDWVTLEDAWKLDESDPRKYVKPTPPMYETAGESGLSSPAVVNDLVFCSTSKIALYAFDAKDGTPLFSDDLGSQTLGFSGGYGYCLGPAISGDYVVAGGLVMGRDGGVLRVFGLNGDNLDGNNNGGD